ncbi:MAG: signal transduction histidine kinase/DNA-binding response OmpR family regulator [Alteromonadaceae bacterium]
MSGWDRQWIYTPADNRRATYAKLPPGQYTLRINAANPGGYWNETPKSLQIIVLPPPWQTWWAYSLYSVSLALLLLVIGRIHYKQLLQQRRKIRTQRRLNRQLKQVDKLKDEFLANTSHELRTPLHGIIGLAESLIDGIGGEQSATSSANLTMIVHSGKRLANLVNNILDFSKLKNHNLILNTKPLGLHSMANVVLTLSKPLLGNKPVKLINNVAIDLPAVIGDEDRLQQILQNLVGNAIRFTDKGQIVINAELFDDHLLIRVSDTGIGIKEAHFATIFNAFEQVTDNPGHNHNGTGLGLTVSKQLVQLHNSQLTVASVVGEGSTFSFTLPISDEVLQPQSAFEQAIGFLYQQESDADESNDDIAEQIGENLVASESSRIRASDGRSYRILLVDDEPVNLQVLRNYLASQNYDLQEASNGEQALQMIAEQECFDLILLDVMMPGMSGYECCEILRKRYTVNDLAVILLTAKNQQAGLAQGFSAGANDYLSKPISKFELLSRVENHLKFLDINRNLEYKVAERTDELLRANQRSTALSEICSRITATLDLDQLFSTLYSHIETLMIVDVLLVGIYNQQKQQIEFELAIENDEYLPHFTLSMSQKNRPAVWCVENRRALIINDYDAQFSSYFGHQPRVEPMYGNDCASVLYFPLQVVDQIIGVMSVQSYEKNAYNEHKQDMLRTIAATTAIALDNVNAYREIELKNTEIIATQQQLLQAEKMASLGTLTAGVAHEINNPTNFVHVSAQNLEVDLLRFERFLFELAGDDTPIEILDSFHQQLKPLYEHLTTIKNGTQRITLIVQDLRTFTQLDSAERKMVKITELLQSTVNLVRTKHLEVSEFITEYAAEPQLQCYPAQLNQVFMNLIVNACDAIEENQQHQQPRIQGRITIGCMVADGQIKISIKDNGSGMSETTKIKLFEPFYTTKDVGKGTGLGLSISYGIVQKHGGELTVESQLGVGTKFCLSLPYSPAD